MVYEHFNSCDDRLFGFIPLGNFVFPAHLHRNFELMIVLTGELVSRVDGKEYHIHAGEALLVFPYQIHSHEESTDLSCRMMFFSPSFIPQFMNKYHEHLPSSNVFTFHNAVDIDFHDNYILRIGYLYTLLGDLMEQVDFVPKKSLGSNDLAVKMLNYANDHFRENCSLMELSEHLNYNYAYASKHFKACIGMDFKRYVNTLRLNYAGNLLKNPGEQNISSIAFESGFSSLCTFNREFKRQFGCSPSEYLSKQTKEV